jgi:two-component response regulator (ARR-A family)
VLIVDVSRVDRKLIEKLLKNSYYKVTIMDSGRRALDSLGLVDDQNTINDLQVNMITTDYSMSRIYHNTINDLQVNTIMTDYSMPRISYA